MIQIQVRFAAGTLLIMFLLAGCASYYPGDRYGIQPPDSRYDDDQVGVLAPTFYGYGEGVDRSSAEDAAAADAIYRAMSVLLGEASTVYAEKMRRVISDIRRLDLYTVHQTRRIIEWDRVGGLYQVILGVRVNLDAAASLLVQHTIRGGRIPDRAAGLRLPDEVVPEVLPGQRLQDVLSRPVPMWGAGEKPVFLVYHAQTLGDPALFRAAAAGANSYLASLGFPYLDYDHVQEILSDQDLVFSDIAGRTSALRWIASRFRNDYFIDVLVETSGRQVSANLYQAEAYISLTCYDSFSAEGKGSVFYQTPAVTSSTSLFSARSLAVQQGIEAAMKRLMADISSSLVADARMGNQYELIFISTTNDQLMRSLSQRIEYRVTNVRRSSFSLDESRYVVVFSGTVTELEDIVYEAASMVPGLSDLYLVYQRGNSVTFHTGL